MVRQHHAGPHPDHRIDPGGPGVLSAFAISTTINERQNHRGAEPHRAAGIRGRPAHTTLSVADAAAATAFIAGSEPQQVRQRYEQAITGAAVAVTRASSDLTDPPLVELLGRINAQLAVYTGLIETARTNNRMGNPVGSSHLSEASALMQDTILPDAQRLYEATSARVDAETTTSAKIPARSSSWWPQPRFRIFAHRWLARRTKRRVNIGLVAGGLAIAVMIVGGDRFDHFDRGQQIRQEHRGRIAAHGDQPGHHCSAGRADETLSLIRRGDEDVRKRSFTSVSIRCASNSPDYLARKSTVDKSGLAQADQLLEKWRRGRRADQRYRRNYSGQPPRWWRWAPAKRISPWPGWPGWGQAGGSVTDGRAVGWSDFLGGLCPSGWPLAFRVCDDWAVPLGSLETDQGGLRRETGRVVGDSGRWRRRWSALWTCVVPCGLCIPFFLVRSISLFHSIPLFHPISIPSPSTQS